MTNSAFEREQSLKVTVGLPVVMAFHLSFPPAIYCQLLTDVQIVYETILCLGFETWFESIQILHPWLVKCFNMEQSLEREKSLLLCTVASWCAGGRTAAE